MQFSLGRNRGPSASGSASTTNSSSEQNSRSAAMQKAIERNRAKMASRQDQRGTPAGAPSRASAPMGTPPPMPRASATSARPRPMSAPSRDEGASSESGSSVLAKLRAQRAQREASAAPKPSVSASPSAAPTRKPITQADNIEMSSPLRKKTTAPAAVNYADQTPVKAIAKAKTAVSAKRKVKSKSKKKGELTHWGVKLCWGFCLFLLGRLVFSQGGVIEYFDKKSTLDQAYHEVTLLKAENDGLMKELDLIRNNHRYKKKLVRDHLGYIARDEYLILFPETSETSDRGLSSI